MKNKLEILCCYACRSDTATTRPIIEKFSKLDWVDCWEISLTPADVIASYKSVSSFLQEHHIDLLYASGDRSEMFGAVMAAFYHHVPVAIYGSGITNTIATYDDINRHAMCLYADICLVEDFKSYSIVRRLHDTIGKTGVVIETVGNLYLEGLDDVDESLVPDEPYDLVLVNPETLGDITVRSTTYYNKQIDIGCNPDGLAPENITGNIQIAYYKNLPRSQFLGLLKNCTKFITNSSSAYYEAPAFLKPEQIMMIGKRNKGRSTPTEWKQEYKTSDRIIDIIEKYWVNKQNE